MPSAVLFFSCQAFAMLNHLEADLSFRCCERTETGSRIGDIEHGHVVVIGFNLEFETDGFVFEFVPENEEDIKDDEETDSTEL